MRDTLAAMGDGGSFGGWLKQARRRRDLSRETLAELVRCAPPTLAKIEQGTRRPSRELATLLLEALQVPPDEHASVLRLARLPLPEPHTTSPPPDHAGVLGAPHATAHHAPALPVAPTSLIGRAAEQAEVQRRLTDPACRLVALVGPGGAGKTRLALQVAGAAAAHFVDGVAWVELAALAAPAQVAHAVADAVGCPLAGADVPDRQLLAWLRDRRQLLVLDNLEHLLQAAPLIAAIMREAPGITLLATSRERLRIQGEWVVEVHGLAIPAEPRLPFAESPALPAETDIRADAPGGDVERYDAVLLFLARARQASSDFALTPADRDAVARICRLVDGLPLAIELAATWTRTLTCQEIAGEITRSIDFLARADRDRSPRHNSMRAVFDHSWQLLTEHERRVLAALAVFHGGCRYDAAAEVAGATLATLATLVDKSLVRTVEDATGGSRCDLHEIVRQYARARLAADPDEEHRTRNRHCAYYARKLGERTPAFLSGRLSDAARDVATDLDNIRAAWAWAVQQRDHHAFALMGQSMQVFCEVRGLFRESVALFGDAAGALRAARDDTPAGAAAYPEIVGTLGYILGLYGIRVFQCGRYAEARALLQESYELLKPRADMLVGSGTLAWLGYMSYALGAYAEARKWFMESIRLSRAHGDTFFLSMSESLLAMTAQAQGSPDALKHARSGLQGWRALGHPRGLATGLGALSSILLAASDLAGAEAGAREGLDLAGAGQDRWATAGGLLRLGQIALARLRIAEAHQLAQQSLRVFTELGDPWGQGQALVTCGWVAGAQHMPDEARRYFQAASDIAGAAQLDPVLLNAQLGLAYLQRGNASMDAQAWLDQILAHPATESATRACAAHLRRELLATGGTAAPPEDTGLDVVQNGSILTAREAEVLRLLAAGRSNQAIAEQMVVAVGTVKRHVNSIMSKLDARTRGEAVAHARDLDLV